MARRLWVGRDEQWKGFFGVGDSESAPSSVQTVTDTDFHHVAVTKNGSTVIFYVDGVANPAVTYNVTFSATNPAAIGARGDNLNNSSWERLTRSPFTTGRFGGVGNLVHLQCW